MAKVAIVTGSNKGLGFSIVRLLCKQFDGDVFLTSRNNERGLAAVKRLQDEGLNPKYHQLDIENVESIQELYAFMMKEYGGVDVLVNNAGVLFLNTDRRPFNYKVDITMNVNYTSTLNMTQTFMPSIKPGGRVVIVSSELGSVGSALCSDKIRSEMVKLDMSRIDDYMKQYIKVAKQGEARKHGFVDFGEMSPYLMSKVGATLIAMVHGKKAAEEGKGVLVNACTPGFIDTDMTKYATYRNKEKKTADVGADTPVYLALLPQESHIQGRFIVDRADKTDEFVRGTKNFSDLDLLCIESRITYQSPSLNYHNFASNFEHTRI